jgi:Flp pilus assembly protein TadG
MNLKRSALSRYLRDDNGAAAAETAIFVLVLAPIILNLVDLGAYAYKRMQVENAAQAGAQAAWATCTKPPASASNCQYLSSAVTGAVAGTSLSNTVVWSNASAFTGTPPASDAGYFCPDGANNALTASSLGSTCTKTGAKAGYYVKIAVSYPFQPIFTGFSVAALLPTPITRTTWMRIE